MTDIPQPNPSTVPVQVAVAGVRKKRNKLIPSIIVLVIVALTALITLKSYLTHGEVLEVSFTDLHGVRVGSSLEFEGHQVGEVTRVTANVPHGNHTLAIELECAPEVTAALIRKGSQFYISRFSGEHLQFTGATRMIRGASVVVRSGDPAAPVTRTFEGSQVLPPREEVRWSSAREVVTFREVYGLSVGAPVRHRGVDVGQVEAVGLSSDGGLASVRIAFFGSAADSSPYTDSRTRFYVNQARLSTKGIEGDASTVIYGPHISVVPDLLAGLSAHTPVTEIRGQDEAPPLNLPRVGEKQLVLDSAQWMPADTPVFYRGQVAGYIHSATLASDGNSHWIRIRIYPDRAPLVCKETKFFNQAKLNAELFRANGLFSWQGPRFEIPDPQLLLRPAIEFRTPPNSVGEFDFAPHDKPSFQLHSEPQEEWLQWTSYIPHRQDPGEQSKVVYPQVAEVQFSWKQRWRPMGNDYSGMGIVTSRGLIAPRNLLEPSIGDADVKEDTLFLKLNQQTVSWDRNLIITVSPELRLFTGFKAEGGATDVGLARINAPSDILIVTRPGEARAVPVSKIRDRAEVWEVDQSVPCEKSWHGAPVICDAKGSDAYGKIVGVLVEGSPYTIALWPREFVAQAK